MDEFLKAYSYYYPYFLQILINKLKKVNDAEDICQEVFFKFYNNFDKIETDAQKSWLFTAVKYEITNFYRNKDRGNETFDIEDYKDDKNLSFVNGARDIRILINEAIENKENFNNEEDKVLFELIAIFKYSYKEAGKALNLSKRQVEYKYDQITKRIVQYLKDRGIKSVGDIYG